MDILLGQLDRLFWILMPNAFFGLLLRGRLHLFKDEFVKPSVINFVFDKW